jgi:hypothetical protein
MVNGLGEIWMQHFSARSWNCSNLWDDYLCKMETLLDDRLIRLDDKDPVRRKVPSAEGAGTFFTQFGERDDSRWIAGRLDKSRINFEATLYKTGFDSFGRRRFNSLNICIPSGFALESNSSKLAQLFDQTNQSLECFYGFADEKSVVSAKKPSGTLSIDLNRELPGCFWITHFGQEYSAYFGAERLTSLKDAIVGPGAGTTIKLGKHPRDTKARERDELEQALGPNSFASTEGSHVVKEAGQFVLPQEQLFLRFRT